MLSASSAASEGEPSALANPYWTRLLICAAEDPSHWAEVFDYLETALGFSQTALVVAQDGFQNPQPICFHGARTGRQQWFARDPVWRALQGRSTEAGDLFFTHELVGDGELEQNEFYREKLGPRDWHYGFVLTLLAEHGRSILLTMLRDREQGPCHAHDVKPLLANLGAMQSAVRLAQRVERCQQDHAALARVANRVPHGYLLLTRDLRIVFANDQASRILDGRFFLRIHGDRLFTAESSLEAQVSEMLSRMVNPVRWDGWPGVLRIRKPDGSAELWLYPERIKGARGTWRRSGAEIALVLIASDEECILKPELLASLFHLTEAEARVASLAAIGMSMAEVAERSGRKLMTVKSQLSQVYKKTGVNRQSELVILMMRAAGL